MKSPSANYRCHRTSKVTIIANFPLALTSA
jgi:hypothetical protein